MNYDQMTFAFSSVIRDAIIQYENQTPLYYYIGYYGSWFLLLLGVAYLILTIKSIKKFYPLFVSICCIALGYNGIQLPRPNPGVYYGYSLINIAYPDDINKQGTFLHQADYSNPICCSINEEEYLHAKRMGIQNYADLKAKALVDLVKTQGK